MRLDRYLATHSDATRNLAKMAIKSGRVEVNGEVVKDQGRKLKAEDVVCVNGRELAESSEIYIVMNKQAGIICATQDEEQVLRGG